MTGSKSTILAVAVAAAAAWPTAEAFLPISPGAPGPSVELSSAVPRTRLYYEPLTDSAGVAPGEEEDNDEAIEAVVEDAEAEESSEEEETEAVEADVAETIEAVVTEDEADAVDDTAESTTATDELKIQKQKLFELLGAQSKFEDPVLADPITKEPIAIEAPGVLLGGQNGRGRSFSYQISSASNTFGGSSSTFLNLLEPTTSDDTNEEETPTPASDPSSVAADLAGRILKQAMPYVPPPLRAPLVSLTGDEGSYIPMRDLFTSPAVSYAYERGWRQGFSTAGFPGPDVEAEMAMDYFAPVVALAGPSSSVVVDMSCATGLFTRRFASTDKYGRVLGCDYSEAMLTEARRRIDAEPKLKSLQNTSLDLVQLDVGRIPMRDETVDCLHAGAAMHCWPDLNAAMAEIHRVLKPGGRYFATTFLSTYFGTLSSMDGQASVPPSQQAFQYFESVDSLKDLLVGGGFQRENILIEVLGNACVVIRAEKEL